MANINIIYDQQALPTQAQQGDINEAALVWGAAILDAVTIQIKVMAVPMQGGHNAMCIPGIVQSGNQTLTRAQAKLRHVAIVDPAPVPLDMVILIDSGTPWVTGFPPATNPVVGQGQYSLLTTVLHELCHGLGFLGLCNVTPGPNLGIYSDTNLIGLLPAIAPASFFPAGLQSGYGWITPFAALFAYQGVLAMLVKGNQPDDYVAFMSAPGSVVIPIGAASYTVLTANNAFVPFTTCDHVVGTDPATHQPFLMSSTTAGLFLAAPDTSSLALLRAIGWNC
jgi:hypothetical protein